MEELQDKPFVLIGVNSDPLERAKAAVAKNKLNWRSFQNQPKDGGKPISEQWKVSGWPTLVVLDHEMRIQYRGHSGHEATAVAKRLLDAMPSGGK